MKFKTVLDMLFELLKKRKVTATYFAQKYNLSIRTVYRYVEELKSGLPLIVTRGRNGGIALPDSYKLPVNYMTASEYTAAIEAIELAYCYQPQERFLRAKEKLEAEYKPEWDDDYLDETVLQGDGFMFVDDEGNLLNY